MAMAQACAHTVSYTHLDVYKRQVAFSVVSAVVLLLTMLVKLWMGSFNRTVGTRIDSPTLLAAMQDSINDVVTTGVVLILSLIHI